MAALLAGMASSSIASTGSNMMDKMKTMVGLKEEQPKTILNTIDEAVTLTWKQRIIGFGACFGIGIVLTMISLIMLWTLHIVMFAITYSLGSVLSICSTMFLMGPVKQCQKMFEQNRFIATSVYVAAIIGTLLIAFLTHSGILVMMMLVIQIAALVWYCMTWIPGGQGFLKALIFRG